MFNLDTALATWRHQFTHTRTFSDADLDEMERHLRDQVEDLVAAGHTPEAAFREAAAEMGGLAEAEHEYGKVHWQKVRQRGSIKEELDIWRAMATSYVRLAYRTLLRNKASSVINIVGLAMAVGCTLVVYTYIDLGLQSDRFHPDGERIFLVEHVIDREGRSQTWGRSPYPLGPALAADFPQIEQAVRVETGRTTMQANGKVFFEHVRYADPAFLDVFHFPLRYGETTALQESDAVILSDRIARKYFGDENPMGATVLLTFGDRQEVYTVRGVAEPFPQAASFAFRLLIPYEHLYDHPGPKPDDWGAFTTATFIKLRDAEALPAIAENMERYRTLQNAASEDWAIEAFVFDDLYSLSRNSSNVRADISGGESLTGYLLLVLIAAFLLALACTNYINIAIATVQRRLKEIGVRKVVGGKRSQLVLQFLCENVLLCLLALVLGIGLAATLFLPGFFALFNDGGTPMTLDLGGNVRSWVFLAGLLTLIGLLSGAYPALYISRFQPTAILRHEPISGRKRWFTRSLLTFQFVLTFITAVAGFLFFQNASYQTSQPWGYERENLVVMVLREDGHFGPLAQEIRQMPSVQAVTGGVHHPGRRDGFGVVDVAGAKVEASLFEVGTGFFSVLGIPLQAGRAFEAERGGEAATALVNEIFARAQDWTAEGALGQQVRYDSTTYTVIGVVADFHYEDFESAIEPTLFRQAEDEQARYLTARVDPGTDLATVDAFQALWADRHPALPSDIFLQREVFAEVDREMAGMATFFAFIAAMALLISCMGLFGLASQNIAQRMQEIGIRKVLGASIPQVAIRVNRGFLILLLVAAGLALPLAYVALHTLLNEVYAYRPPLGVGPFLLACGVILITALLTLATQLGHLVRTNPAEVLRRD